MLERAQARREKLDKQLSSVGEQTSGKKRIPLLENNHSSQTEAISGLLALFVCILFHFYICTNQMTSFTGYCWLDFSQGEYLHVHHTLLQKALSQLPGTQHLCQGDHPRVDVDSVNLPKRKPLHHHHLANIQKLNQMKMKEVCRLTIILKGR